MKKDEIHILREKIVHYLDIYNGPERVKLPIELLETLLFETVEVSIAGKVYRVKIPVWSGMFLSKVDLSEVDFANVLWNDLICIALNGVFTELIDAVREIKGNTPSNDFFPYKVCYANTNAQIDLAQSFLFSCGEEIASKYERLISIDSCDFSGTIVKLPEVGTIQILRSNLARTQFSMPVSPYGRKNVINNSDLSDNNLSNIFIDGLDNAFYHTSFRNSGIKVAIDVSRLENYLKFGGDIKELIIIMFNDYFVGCEVNGVLLEEQTDSEKNLRLVLNK